MSDEFKQDLPILAYALIPMCAALAAGGYLAWRMGLPFSWPAMLLPVSGALFAGLWTRVLFKRATRIGGQIIGAALGIVLLHLFLWLPFLFNSYLSGQGLGRVDYSALAAIFTAGAVGWYILGAYFWETVAFFALVTTIAIYLRRNRIGSNL